MVLTPVPLDPLGPHRPADEFPNHKMYIRSMILVSGAVPMGPTRPLLQETIHLGWANYGDPIPRNLDDEIA